MKTKLALLERTSAPNATPHSSEGGALTDFTRSLSGAFLAGSGEAETDWQAAYRKRLEEKHR